MFNLELNAISGFNTLSEARTIGTAVERLIGTPQGGIKIFDTATGQTHTILNPTEQVDRTNYIHGGQEAEGRANFYIKKIDALRDANTTDTFWDDFLHTVRTTGDIDLLSLSALVSERLNVEDASQVVSDIVGAYAANEALKQFNLHKAQQARLERQNKQQGHNRI